MEPLFNQGETVVLLTFTTILNETAIHEKGVKNEKRYLTLYNTFVKLPWTFAK